MLTRGSFLADAGALAAAALAPPRREGAALARFARSLDGSLLTAGSAGYDAARLLFNARYDGVHPLAIVRAATPADVARTLAFAQHARLPLVARSGGHSFAGWSTGRGIVLDVAPMHRVAIAASGTRVRVGPGARLIDVVRQLAPAHLTVPAGVCPTVGVTGLTLGGGIGRMTRTHGLTLDRLRSVRLVDARGRVLTADRETHPDLFWACRGGGGGNFGVVTELEFDVVPLPATVTRYAFAWPWSQRAQAFEAWQQWSIAAPRAFQSSFTFSTAAPGETTPSVSLDGTYLGPQDEAAPHLAELQAAVGVAPVRRTVDVTDYVTALADGPTKRLGLAIGSTFVRGRWPAAAVDVLAHWLEQRQRDPLLVRDPAGENLGKVWFDAVGGAVAAVAPDATAYVHRQATFCVQYQARWNAGAPDDVQRANRAWLRGFRAAMAPWNAGAYVNYADPELTDPLQEYYGANLTRLRAVKRAYDPHDLFRTPQSL